MDNNKHKHNRSVPEAQKKGGGEGDQKGWREGDFQLEEWVVKYCIIYHILYIGITLCIISQPGI
jgi:hypothetical protein